MSQETTSRRPLVHLHIVGVAVGALLQRKALEGQRHAVAWGAVQRPLALGASRIRVRETRGAEATSQRRQLTTTGWNNRRDLTITTMGNQETILTCILHRIARPESTAIVSATHSRIVHVQRVPLSREVLIYPGVNSHSSKEHLPSSLQKGVMSFRRW